MRKILGKDFKEKNSKINRHLTHKEGVLEK